MARPFPVILGLLLTAACAKGSAPRGSPSVSPPSARSTSPAVPPVPKESPAYGPGQPPVVWVGGVLTEVGQRNLVIRDVLGASVSLRRLGQEATAVYRASGQRWVRLDPKIPIEAGTEACVETALEGRNLLALRVFLGATCGPTA